MQIFIFFLVPSIVLIILWYCPPCFFFFSVLYLYHRLAFVICYLLWDFFVLALSLNQHLAVSFVPVHLDLCCVTKHTGNPGLYVLCYGLLHISLVPRELLSQCAETISWLTFLQLCFTLLCSVMNSTISSLLFPHFFFSFLGSSWSHWKTWPQRKTRNNLLYFCHNL